MVVKPVNDNLILCDTTESQLEGTHCSCDLQVKENSDVGPCLLPVPAQKVHGSVERLWVTALCTATVFNPPYSKKKSLGIEIICSRHIQSPATTNKEK